jgi:hypothetical protein
VHHIPNYYRIADSARAAIVFSQCRPFVKRAAGVVVEYSLKTCETDQFIPERCSLAGHVCTLSVGNKKQSVVEGVAVAVAIQIIFYCIQMPSIAKLCLFYIFRRTSPL